MLQVFITALAWPVGVLAALIFVLGILTAEDTAGGSGWIKLMGLSFAVSCVCAAWLVAFYTAGM